MAVGGRGRTPERRHGQWAGGEEERASSEHAQGGVRKRKWRVWGAQPWRARFPAEIWGSQKTNTVTAAEQPPKASCLEHVGVTRRVRGCARGRQSGAPVAALTSATGMWTSDAGHGQAWAPSLLAASSAPGLHYPTPSLRLGPRAELRAPS